MQMLCVQSRDSVQPAHCKDSCVQGLVLVAFAIGVNRYMYLVWNSSKDKKLTRLDELWLMESMTGSKAKSMLPTCCVPNKMPPMHMKVTDRAMEMICIDTRPVN